MKTIFLRMLEAEDKQAGLRAATDDPGATGNAIRFEADPASFAAIPRSPFAYWASDRMRQLFQELPPFEADGRTAKVGLQTSDDFRFVRAWWEVPPAQIGQRWFSFAKGGEFSPFYADVHLVVNWEGAGRQLKAWAGSLYNHSHWSRILKNTGFYFRPGITWSRRTQGGLSLRAMPEGCIFADKGPCALTSEDRAEKLLALLALGNSSAFRSLVELQMAFGSYEVGVVQRAPVPSDISDPSLATLARHVWSLERSRDTAVEVSHAFGVPCLLRVDGDTLGERIVGWESHCDQLEAEVTSVGAEIDARCFDLYGLDEHDRRAITEHLGAAHDGGARDERTDSEPGDCGGAEVDDTQLVADLISWAVGVAFGRFDVRLATGARDLPVEPEPFDQLPVCPPGMLVGNDGLPMPVPPNGYPLAFPADGILVDDHGHERDISAALRRVFEVVLEARADEVWREAAATLDPGSEDLRGWIASNFFAQHVKRYSKSHRKAPIYWQLGVPSGRYSVWLYAHRLTADSLFQLQNEIAAPKLAYEERHLATLTQEAGGTPSASERRHIEAQQRFVEELRVLLAEIRRVAPLWRPSLDDGVVLAMAPLWRLVPQHRPWQRELKSHWDDLVAGKYDWAQIAMRLWPERVLPKCATDLSLAIAHGLEEVFWAKDEEGSWQQRATPTPPIDELVRERTSGAVKSALEDLLAQPTPSGGRSRGRRAASTRTKAGR